MLMSRFVPWRQIASWHCSSCGCCCKDYSVVLSFPEWLRISNTFGSEATAIGFDKLFIKRTIDGSCAFLCRLSTGDHFCRLQSMKPNACKIWPFKILVEPKYGEPRQAVFDYLGKRLYVYADSNCNGLKYGSPSWEFSKSTLKEFASIALGACPSQRESTRNVKKFSLRRI
jgi:Fe-S-cluster containining protein